MEEAHFEMVASLARVRAGDDAAARELVEHLYPLVIRVVRGHRPRAMAEEDLAQEIFMKMFSRLDQFRGEVPFEHWVSRIALTTCIDHLRSQYRKPEWRMADLGEEEAQFLEECCTPDAAASGMVESVAARELAGKLLEFLSPKDQVVVTMLDMEGRSVAEVSQVTGINSALVKVRAFRARRKLRQIMLRWQKEKKV